MEAALELRMLQPRHGMKGKNNICLFVQNNLGESNVERTLDFSRNAKKTKRNRNNVVSGLSTWLHNLLFSYFLKIDTYRPATAHPANDHNLFAKERTTGVDSYVSALSATRHHGKCSLLRIMGQAWAYAVIYVGFCLFFCVCLLLFLSINLCQAAYFPTYWDLHPKHPCACSCRGSGCSSILSSLNGGCWPCWKSTSSIVLLIYVCW